MKIKDLAFKRLITQAKIEKRVSQLALQISSDYENKIPVLLPVLNGSFMFASDLIKELTIPCRVSFVKTSSYQGTQSTGQLKTLIGHEESLFNQDILIVEDIVDSGTTLQKIIQELRDRGARSVEAVALLRKKAAREKKAEVKYVGLELDDEFVVGYGLDYDGLGRNYKDIYRQIDSGQ
jgi:hypoxanthine phosphoribosyltransferase